MYPLKFEIRDEMNFGALLRGLINILQLSYKDFLVNVKNCVHKSYGTFNFSKIIEDACNNFLVV